MYPTQLQVILSFFMAISHLKGIKALKVGSTVVSNGCECFVSEGPCDRALPRSGGGSPRTAEDTNLGSMVGKLVIFLFSVSFLLFVFMVMPLIGVSCHMDPRVELQSLSIRDMTVSSAPDSPRQVNSQSNATFSTGNRNTVPTCFITALRMDVRVEYRGQVILQQQLPLGFSLKPHASREFSIKMKVDHAQLKKDLGPAMRAETRSGNTTLTFSYNVRYLTSLRRSKWRSGGCVLIAKLISSHSGTMLWQECSSL